MINRKDNKTAIYGDIVEIVWRDSCMYLTQCNKSEPLNIEEITSTGFFIKEDDEKIVIAGDLLNSDSGELRRVISIPKENIIEIK